MDYPDGFPISQPYHNLVHILSIPGSEHGSYPADQEVSTAHDFLNSPISPIQDSLGPQQRCYGIGNTIKPFELADRTSQAEQVIISSQSRRKARRKAQNRAAQQAFRRRKEMHLGELESKLASLAAAQQQALVENDSLKQALHINDILRAVSQINVKDHHSLVPAIFDSSQYYANFAPTDDLKNSPTSTTSKDGERLVF
ncbi:hypothetical protein BGZ63DRAFT_429534 [Mariannaea sp. PMI_226]|nr:hypothetical protein BGZ63DRAFT_429534 [Mariannaea sp. PMI_226]